MSKADVNKIVELIMSNDESNQELGCMMAVSQGVKDECLKNIYEYMIVLGEKYAHIKRESIEKIYFIKGHYAEWSTVVVRGGTEITVKNKYLVQICKGYLKLKEYVLL